MGLFKPVSSYDLIETVDNPADKLWIPLLTDRGRTGDGLGKTTRVLGKTIRGLAFHPQTSARFHTLSPELMHSGDSALIEPDWGFPQNPQPLGTIT